MTQPDAAPSPSAALAHRTVQQVVAIVLAAGSGSRFGSMKQFAVLRPEQRLVDAAVAAVSKVAARMVVVVHHATDAHERERLLEDPSVVGVVDGGASRLDSVACGLAALGDAAHRNEIAIIHDAAHPLASTDLTAAVCRGLGSHDACVPFLEAVDVVRRVDAGPGGLSTTVGRAGLGAAQVPMAFARSSLEAAHAARRDDPNRFDSAVEDSHLVELHGGRVATVPGEVTNIHVVDQPSLDLARLIANLSPFHDEGVTGLGEKP